MFQSTRPRGARHVSSRSDTVGLTVSIHAPAWGATFFCFFDFILMLVSIHAPAWGATNIQKQYDTIDMSFNPRARVGRDQYTKTVRYYRYEFQSTRPRGARHEASYYRKRIRDCFNPRARVGRDGSVQPISHKEGVFQSTRPRGARHVKVQHLLLLEAVSIHAPAWGATRSLGCGDRFAIVSIHAPAWGATIHTSA